MHHFVSFKNYTLYKNILFKKYKKGSFLQENLCYEHITIPGMYGPSKTASYPLVSILSFLLLKREVPTF